MLSLPVLGRVCKERSAGQYLSLTILQVKLGTFYWIWHALRHQVHLVFILLSINLYQVITLTCVRILLFAFIAAVFAATYAVLFYKIMFFNASHLTSTGATFVFFDVFNAIIVSAIVRKDLNSSDVLCNWFCIFVRQEEGRKSLCNGLLPQTGDDSLKFRHVVELEQLQDKAHKEFLPTCLKDGKPRRLHC